MSLRLDGHGFSKRVKALRRRGVIEAEGFSDAFAEGMKKAVVSLMEETHGWIGYTQSDEMTVLVPPARVVRGVQQVRSVLALGGESREASAARVGLGGSHR